MQRYNRRKQNAPSFPYKRNNYPDWKAKARSCFEYLESVDYSSADRLVISKEPITVKNLSRLSQDDFAFTCPSDIGVEDDGPVYVTIKSIDTDYENMNIFSDLFIEEARMNASMYKKISPMKFWQINHEKIRNALFLKGEPITNHNLREMLYTMNHNGRGECTTFRPAIAYAIAKMFKFKRVWDPCTGWGDRYFGFMAAGVDLYASTDPNRALVAGHKGMQELLDPTGNRTKIMCKGCEEFSLDDIGGEKVDGVMTSPPYFDMEDYSGDATQSIKQYNSESTWTKNFLLPLFDRAVSVTKSGGHVILNIEMMDGRNTYVYDLIDYAKSQPDKVTYCQMITYQGSRYAAHAPIFVFKVV